MDKTLELTLGIISAIFVLCTAMIDPMASLIVAVVAILCFVAYRMMFNKPSAKKTATVKKTVVAKKSVKKKGKKK